MFGIILEYPSVAIKIGHLNIFCTDFSDEPKKGPFPFSVTHPVNRETPMHTHAHTNTQ